MSMLMSLQTPSIVARTPGRTTCGSLALLSAPAGLPLRGGLDFRRGQYVDGYDDSERFAVGISM